MQSPAITQGRSTFFLLPFTGTIFIFCQSISPAPVPQVEGQPLSIIPLKLEPKRSPPPKRHHSSMDAQGDMSIDEDFPITLQEESSNSKKGKTDNWLTSMKSECADAFSQDSDPVKEVRSHYFTTHSWAWTHSNMKTCWTYSRDSPKKLAYWVSLFSSYKGHGRD